MRIRFVWCLLLASSALAADNPGFSVDFAGTAYLHRWSKAGQNEFTPKGQEDLDHWVDMVTIDVHDKVQNAQDLEALYRQVVERYQSSGRVLKADPPSSKDPDHFAAAVLAGKDVLEAAFAHFTLREGKGVVVVYSHRVYGAKASADMGAWITAHGQGSEDLVKGWAGIPTLERLGGLPQSP